MHIRRQGTDRTCWGKRREMLNSPCCCPVSPVPGKWSVNPSGTSSQLGVANCVLTHPSPQKNVQEVQVPPALDFLLLLLILQGCLSFPDDLVWVRSTECHCLGTHPLPKGKRRSCNGRGQERPKGARLDPGLPVCGPCRKSPPVWSWAIWQARRKRRPCGVSQ